MWTSLSRGTVYTGLRGILDRHPDTEEDGTK